MSSNKVFVIGLDGMDPSLTKKYMDQGKMPNVKKLVDAGACREDLVMLGGHPTVTPPMWTTLATGANRALTASPVSGIRIRTVWTPLCITWTPECVRRNSYGMSLRKPVKRHWYGIGLVLPGRHLLTAQICMLLMVLSRQLYR